MPKAEAEKVYAAGFDKVFGAAQEALRDSGAKVEKADKDSGEITAVRKFQLFKKAHFVVKVAKQAKGTKVAASAKLSAWTAGVIDIGKMQRFLQDFFEKLDARVE